ncbi:hypothetical protein A3730_07970 [Alcanivorax sp. HI0044]|uniref:hypothetical protein n=1 Tax=Alcanivorax sp. HI0044 TaxID=1822234 RepID=UPI0007B9A4BB|nr:hypothetical protein [Alcanivorax sp. HI0044]KZY28660.1 hypothetical protein A3730_07970 [Alcanivorax sp. HI0044]
MKTRIMTLLASAALAMPAASLAADVPQRGMSQSQVRAEFGAPNQSKGPVGSPAITRWFYNGFTVYFENNTALHTVVDRPVSAAPDVVSGQQVDTLPPLQEKTAAQSSEPAPATADNGEDKGELMFDPVSGRFVSEDNSGNDAATASSAEPKPAAPPAAAATTAPATSESTTAPTPAPASSATAPAADTSAEGEFRFDPVTGRIIIAGEDTPEQAAKKKAASVEKEAQQSVDQASEAANQAVEDSQAKAQSAVDDANEKAQAAQAEAEQNVEEHVEQAEQTQQAAEDAANDVKDTADDGGFYIDWGASQ